MLSQQDSIQKLNKHRTTTKREGYQSGGLSGDETGVEHTWHTELAQNQSLNNNKYLNCTPMAFRSNA